MSDITERKPELIVVSAVKQLVKDLGNQSGPDFLLALDAQIAATVRKACSDIGPNKRLDESALYVSAPVKVEMKDEYRTRLRALRDEACHATLQVNVIVKKDYLKFFETVKQLATELLNEK